MRKLLKLSGLVSCLLAVQGLLGATVTMEPLSSFRGSDGWFAPGEDGYTFLGTANNERGLAYGNDHLYLASRSGGLNVRVLDPVTGLEVGSLNTTNIAGGTFALNMIGVGGDGLIYGGNLTTTASTTAFQVYRWANELALPTRVFSNTFAVTRIGDTFDVSGSGTATRIIASGGGTPATSSFALIDPSDGSGSMVSLSGTSAGDFRLGMTFLDSDTVIGTQAGTNINPWRVVDLAGTTGTLAGSPLWTSLGERPMDYAVVGGVGLLATVDTISSEVRLYDMTDPVNPLLLTSGNNTSGALTANGNGVGAVAWGDIAGDTATLYAMSCNQGIQAFLVTVPEPATMGLLLVGGGLFLLIRRRR